MKTRKMSIRAKLIVAITALAMLSSVGVGAAAYQRVSAGLLEQSQKNTMEIAQLAANELDADFHDQIMEGMEGSAEYLSIYECLTKFKEETDIDYIYTLKRQGDKVVYVVDTADDAAGLFEECQTLDGMDAAFGGEKSVDSTVRTIEGAQYYTAYAPICTGRGEVVGIVGVDVNMGWINQQLSSLRLAVVGVVVVCIVICFVCGFLLAGSIGRNLRRLNNKVLELSSNDGDLTKKIRVTSGDELEIIAGNMNLFIEEIRGLVEKINHTAYQVENSSSDVSKTSLNGLETINGIAATMENLSASMEETTASSEVIESSIVATSDKVTAIARQSEEIRQSTEVIQCRADQIKSDARDAQATAKDQIAKMQQNMDESAKKSQSVENISKLADKVLSIAQQTQILALNSRIEAARAGDAGKGFCVVSEEIGHLSEEISTAVKEIQETSDEVVGAVRMLQKECLNITDYINENVLEEYSVLVEVGTKYSDDAGSIHQVMENVAEGAADIESSISNIKESIYEINRAILDSTKGITETHELAVGLADEMGGLTEIARQNTLESQALEEQVNKYTY